MEERVTIRELARRSGVSVGTVSRALNGYTDVRPETRERIMRLASELDYTPAAAARSLVTQRSHVIGVFMETGEGHPDLQHPFFHEVLGGLKQRVGREGFDLLLFASERPGGGYGRHSYLKRARHHNVDGCALIGLDPDDDEVRRLARGEMPCVAIDMQLEGPLTEVVMSDNEDGAATAVRHLYDLGHRRIATITGMIDSRPGIDRLRGYRAAIQELGLAYRDDYVRYGDFYAESGREQTARLLALDEPPTAIFAAADMMAIGAVRAASEAGPDRAGRPQHRRVRRHPACSPREPAPHHAAPGQARPGRGGRRCPRGTDRRRSGASVAPDAPRRARRTRQHRRSVGETRFAPRPPPAAFVRAVPKPFLSVVQWRRENPMPKRLAIVASAIALVLAPAALVACGGDDSGSDSTTPKSAAQGEAPLQKGTTLTLWTMPNSPQPKEDLQKMVEPFTAKTGVKVDVQEVGWDVQFDRIRNAAVAGEGPDITQAGTTQVPFFAALGGFTDLSDRVEEIGGKGAYAEGIWNTTQVRGPGRHVGRAVVHRGALDLLPQGRAREGGRRSRDGLRRPGLVQGDAAGDQGQGAGHRAVRRARQEGVRPRPPGHAVRVGQRRRGALRRRQAVHDQHGARRSRAWSSWAT